MKFKKSFHTVTSFCSKIFYDMNELSFFTLHYFNQNIYITILRKYLLTTKY